MFRSLQFTILAGLLFISCSITAQKQNFRTHSSMPVSQLPPENQLPVGDRNGAILFDQLKPLANHMIACHKITEPGWTQMSCSTADDFLVPQGENWQVQSVQFYGSYIAESENLILYFNINFYNDDDGEPGSVIYNFNNITTFTEIGSGEHWTKFYEISLPSVAELPAGNYWIEIQPALYSEQWYIYQSGVTTSGCEYHWRNPANGFGLGFTTWTPGSDFSPASSYNLSFRLIAAGLSNDIRSAGVINPVNSPDLTSEQSITINIKNEGAFPVSGFEVCYSIDNGPVVTENVDTLSIGNNQFEFFTFYTPANLSQAGPHNIRTWTASDLDPNHLNDTSSTIVYNLGTIYPMIDTGMQTLEICNATFTDPSGFGTDLFISDEATTTIYPENEGDRIVLDILEYHAGGSFIVYNGPDITSQMLWQGHYDEETPCSLTAINPSGCLTIRFDGFVNAHYPGWVAFVSCITPQNDEFSVNTLKRNLLSVFEGDTVLLETSIHNIGTASHEKLVTFKANGNVIGTDYSGFVAPYDTAFITIPWIVPEEGEYLIEVSIEDDYDNSNNKKSITLSAIDLDIPYSFTAEGDTSEMNLNWQNPTPESLQMLCYDDGIDETYYGGNNTTQWFGNLFEINEPTTIMSFEMALTSQWPEDGDISTVAFDIIDLNGNLLYRTHDYVKREDRWYTVEIPDLTFTDAIYAMAYFTHTNNASYYIKFDNDTVPGHGYLRYAGQGFGQMMGSFLIRANILKGNNNQEDQFYNVRFGNIDDIEHTSEWPLLNSTPVNGTQYTDLAWPPSEPGTYIYAVCTTDSTGESGFSFSNILQWDPVNTFNHSIPGIKIYPNPSSDYLNIETSGKSTLLIYNMQGKMLFSQEITTDTYSLNTSQFSKGTYLIVLRNHNGLRQQKVLIQ